MADITEIAVAAWRLDKWLNNLKVERKMAAKSALRSIKKYLSENDIEIIDLTGSKFDVGLAVSVVNNESDETDEEKLIISEMVKPIVLQRGSVIQYGQVILGDEVKKTKENNEIKTREIEEVDTAEKVVVAVVNDIADSELPREEEKHKEETIIVDKEEKNSEKKKSFWSIVAWGSLASIQVAVIILLVINMNSIKELTIENNTPKALEETTSTEIDFSGLNEKFYNIDFRFNTIDEKLNTIESKIEGENLLSKYIVKSGDTLIGICDRQGINYYEYKDEILKLNNMDNPNHLRVGQEIKLPRE